MECLKAATLKHPINRQLGFAYIIAYADKPQFQMGFKGIIQLGLRTGQFRYLNADCVYEGMKVEQDHLTGRINILGAAKSNVVVGYFAYMELLSGFTKAVYITIDDALAHAKKYSRAYQYDIKQGSKSCPWSTDPNAMGKKTAIKMLSKYFPMTVDLARALDDIDEQEFGSVMRDDANSKIIDGDQHPEGDHQDGENQ